MEEKGIFLYIDLMRLSSPKTPSEKKSTKKMEYDFSMLGSFSAMKVVDNIGGKPIKEISGMQKRHKERYDDVSEMFDRQPLYLYSKCEIKKGIFDISEDPDPEKSMAVRPLVMTLFQLWDEKLECEGQDESEADNLIDVFTNKIEELKNRKGYGKEIQFQVFYCLGESDIAVVFRSREITSVGRILYDMRVWKEMGSGINIQVLSNSSYCAFPRSADRLEENIQEWLKYDKETEIVTLTNTSYGLNNNANPKCGRYLLGEWDHYWCWREEHDSHYEDIVSLFAMDDAYKYPGSFRTVHTIPSIKLEDTVINAVGEETVAELYKEANEDFNEKVYENFAVRVKKIPEIILKKRIKDNYVDNLVQLTGTLAGLHKHLVRLLFGRFEGDLYAFVNPVFKTLEEITENAGNLTDKYAGAYKIAKENGEKKKSDEIYENIINLLDEYLYDLSELLSELQHMFSILSVSPYSYLETYGSNMRSIAAACKLLVAYEGVAYSLGDSFGMKINGEKVTETFIVLPYRNIICNTREYFEETSPMNNICRIYIDFTKMFHIRSTLFILLHECGHQLIGTEFRGKRMVSYAKSVMAALEYKTMKGFYTDVSNRIGNGRAPENRNEYKFEVKRCRECEARICGYLKENCDDFGKTILENWDEYKEERRDCIEPDKLEACIFDTVKDAVYRAIQPGAGTPDALKESLKEMIEKIYAEYGKLVSDEMNDRGTRCSLWELNALYIDFTDKNQRDKKNHAVVEGLSKRFRKYADDICEELKDTFREIYSDVFAYIVLGVDEDEDEDKKQKFVDYIGILIQNCGCSVYQQMLSPNMILRVMAIYKGLIGGTSDSLADIMKDYLTEDQYKKFIWQIDLFENSIMFPYVMEYTESCVCEIRDHMKNGTGLKKTAEEIRKLYRAGESSNPGEIARGIHYFWKQSTQRKINSKG